MHDVAITDDMIRLGQFLKLANLVDSGSDARRVIATGSVEVNGEVELRRGCQLHRAMWCRSAATRSGWRDRLPPHHYGVRPSSRPAYWT